MKDEGFLTAAGWRFVLLGTLLIAIGVFAYFLATEEISIDLDELTQTTTEATTEIDVPEVSVPDVTVPSVAGDPYLRCVERSQTVEEILACAER